MANFSIEYASIKDIKQLNSIINYYIETSNANWSRKLETLEETRQWFLSHDFAIHPIFITKTPMGKAAGYACLSPFRSKDGYWPTAEISIYVDKEFHKQKIGASLMDALLNHAYSSKLEAITAWIDSENTYSIEFHEKWEFKIVGQMKNVGDKWGKRRSVTIMQLDVINK